MEAEYPSNDCDDRGTAQTDKPLCTMSAYPTESVMLLADTDTLSLTASLCGFEASCMHLHGTLLGVGNDILLEAKRQTDVLESQPNAI